MAPPDVMTLPILFRYINGLRFAFTRPRITFAWLRREAATAGCRT
jgi:hypothetical protein